MIGVTEAGRVAKPLAAGEVGDLIGGRRGQVDTLVDVSDVHRDGHVAGGGWGQDDDLARLVLAVDPHRVIDLLDAQLVIGLLQRLAL